MATAVQPSPEPLDYATARYADGPRLARELFSRVPATPEGENVRRVLRAMRDEHRCVRFATVDKLCIRLGLHPALLPDDVLDDV
jgi:hypothetical protein